MQGRYVLVCLFFSLWPWDVLSQHDWQSKAALGTLLYSAHLGSINATIGNGFVATSVGSDTVFLAGVFNGASDTSPSHRARIPGFAAVSFTAAAAENTTDMNHILGFALDLQEASFKRRDLVDAVLIEQRWYASRVRRGLLVVDFCLVANQSNVSLDSSVNIPLQVNTGSFSTDIFPLEIVNISETTLLQRFRTLTPESNFTSVTEICLVQSIVPDILSLSASVPCQKLLFSFATTLDSGDNYESAAVDSFKSAAALSVEDLYQEHVAEWKVLDPTGRITLPATANLTLRQTQNSAMYYLLSSIRADWPFGLSPGGLASNGYNGHTFWDMETWMAPTLLLFYPDLAESMIRYRLQRASGYREKARSYSPPYQGICLAWESAFSGLECCPHNCCASCTREIHINGDFALFARQYYALQNPSSDWLGPLFEFLDGISQFWLSRSTFNPNDGSYSILNVLPPDEYADHAVDSVITNLGASLTLNFTLHLAQSLNISSNPQYAEVASKLRLPFDSSNQRFLEFANYSGQIIKQSDVILMSYPFGFDVPSQVQLNDLTYYTNRTTSSGPAMTWSLTAINYLSLGPKLSQVAEAFFWKSFLPYIRLPFFIWYETPTGGASNFLTGAGGFLQMVPFGYGGLRINSSSGLDLLNHPVMPPEAEEFAINGISIGPCRLSLSFSKNATSKGLHSGVFQSLNSHCTLS